MTTLSDLTLSSHSPQDSWGDLPESESVELKEAPEQVPDKKPAASGHCVACGEVIYREPGKRGRAPKYHPECKPSGSTAAVRTKKVGAAQGEAEQVVEKFASLWTKAAMLVAVADRYDAFVMMVNLKGIRENLRATLIRYPALRKQLLDVEGTGSAVGLVMTLSLTVLPIMAHHGLLPFKTFTPLLINMPKSLHAIQQKLEDGEANLIKVMREQMETGKADDK